MLVYTTPAPSLPCNWDVDPGCCTEWANYDPSLQARAAQYGAFVMWAATGRRYGVCPRTVRPCGRSRETTNTYGYYWSGGVWFPYIFNGVWRNCSGCSGGFGCCTCEPRCQVYLPAPVASIPASGISIDGQIVDASTWRVDDAMWLVRTGGECWPECQDYTADSGTGVFEVQYNQGYEVPSILLSAAGELACEYAKACLGQACRLPSRAQSITRQGVSMSMVNIDEVLKAGLTGVQTVDQVIMMFNPYGLKSPMRISSPDLPVQRTVTQP